MDSFDFISVPFIVSLVYAGIALLKKWVKNNEKVLKLIPLIAAIAGAVLGVVAYYAIPAIIPANNVVIAILIGASSGLAATGTHQIFKQLMTKVDDQEEKQDDSAKEEKDDNDSDKTDKTE